MVAGRSNRGIGNELNIKEATVKSHVSVVLMRLQVPDRTQAVVEALKRASNNYEVQRRVFNGTQHLVLLFMSGCVGIPDQQS